MIVALDFAHLVRLGFLLLILSVVRRHCSSHAVVPLIILPGIVFILTAMPSLPHPIAVLLLLLAILLVLVDRQQVFLAILASDFASGDMRCCPLLSHLPALFLTCSIGCALVLGDLHVGVD